jgi:hypothetical protein
VQRRAGDIHGRNDRDLLLRQLRRKFVFFEYRRVGPAVRAIELRDDGVIIVDAHLVHAILVAVECEQASVTAEAEILEGFEEILRLQIGVGEGGSIAVHLPDDTLRGIRSRG